MKIEFVFDWDILIYLSQSDQSYSLELFGSSFMDFAVVIISYQQHKTNAHKP